MALSILAEDGVESFPSWLICACNVFINSLTARSKVDPYMESNQHIITGPQDLNFGVLAIPCAVKIFLFALTISRL